MAKYSQSRTGSSSKTHSQSIRGAYIRKRRLLQEALERREMFTGNVTTDPIDFHIEIPLVVDDLASMVQATAPQVVQDLQNADSSVVLDSSEQVHLVDPQTWSQIIDSSPICDFGFVLGESPDAHNALTDLVVLEFVDVENETNVVNDLLEQLANELADQQDSNELELPPQFEQLRQELGDEQFAEYLRGNQEQFGNLQGVDEQEIESVGEDAIEQFGALESLLEDWLAGTEEIRIYIGGQASQVWQIDGYELSSPGAADKALPWFNLNTIEVVVGFDTILQGNELQLFGSRPRSDAPDVVIPVTFLGQEGDVGTWVFDDLGDGFYRADVAGHSPISFSVLAGNASASQGSESEIDFGDFAVLATTFGTGVPEANVHAADFNGDGRVGFGDFAVFARNFGADLADFGFAPNFWEPESAVACEGCNFIPNIADVPAGNLNPSPPAMPVDPALVDGENIGAKLLKSAGNLKPDGSIEVTKQTFVGSTDRHRVIKRVEVIQKGPAGNKANVKKTSTHIKDKNDPVGKFTTIVEKEWEDDQKNSKGEVVRPKGTKTRYENDPDKPSTVFRETRPDGSGHQVETPRNVSNGEGTKRTTYGAGGEVEKVEVFTGGKWTQVNN